MSYNIYCDFSVCEIITVRDKIKQEKKKKLLLHTHHIASYITNALFAYGTNGGTNEIWERINK